MKSLRSALLAVVLVGTAFSVGGSVGGPAAAATSPGIKGAGNRLLDGSGAPLRVAGVNRSGTEYACAQGWGLFDGPSDDASVAAMASWGINAARIPLNEDCWLAINGVNAAYAGSNYQNAVRAYVGRCRARGST